MTNVRVVTMDEVESHGVVLAMSVTTLKRVLSPGSEVVVTKSDLVKTVERCTLFGAFDPEVPLRLIGMAWLARYRNLVYEKGVVENVAVDDAFRGQRIGRMLMEAVIVHAKEQGVACLELTSEPRRVEARALYAKLGFKEPGTGLFRLYF